MSQELSPRVWVAEFEWGTVYGGESPREVQAYGIKHRNRFGRPLRVRPATDDDPIDDYRITYTFNEGSPARQRYEARMKAKAEARAKKKREEKERRAAERAERKYYHDLAMQRSEEARKAIQAANLRKAQAARHEKRHPGQLQLFNPATGQLQPAEFITDRAKRYRAQAAIEQPERRCIYCGRPGGRLDTEHINGREADNEARNLAYACRPCNTQKGALFARLNLGSKTRQFNPAAAGARNLAQWTMAVASIRKRDLTTGRLRSGDSNKMQLMPVSEAVAMIRATPPDQRSEYARQIWSLRRQHGTDRIGRLPF